MSSFTANLSFFAFEYYLLITLPIEDGRILEI